MLIAILLLAGVKTTLNREAVKAVPLAHWFKELDSIICSADEREVREKIDRAAASRENENFMMYVVMSLVRCDYAR